LKFYSRFKVLGLAAFPKYFFSTCSIFRSFRHRDTKFWAVFETKIHAKVMQFPWIAFSYWVHIAHWLFILYFSGYCSWIFLILSHNLEAIISRVFVPMAVTVKITTWKWRHNQLLWSDVGIFK